MPAALDAPARAPVASPAPRRMRAAVLVRPGLVEITSVPLPAPGPGDVRVRIEGCGVCASNLGPWTSAGGIRHPLPPGAPGHEGWGTVDAVGSGVRRWAPGQRVAFLSGAAFAEFDLARADQLLALPPELDGLPFPAEPLGCAMNILRRAAVRPADAVAVVGAGFLGCLLIPLLRELGATVFALSRREWVASLTARLGARPVPLDDPEAARAEISRRTGGRGCDVVIEATGHAGPLNLAADLTRERGRLVIAGYHQDGPRTVNMQQWNWRGLDVINAHERDPAVYLAGMRRALGAVRAGTLDPIPLLTHQFPLDELGAALDATRDRPEGFMKAIVRP